MFLFVRRDFVSQYKQTLLGPLWLSSSAALHYGHLQHHLRRVSPKFQPTECPEPVFYMAGTTLWNYFSSCLSGTSSVFSSNAGIFSKVYFPRLTVPLTTIITKLYTFAIQLVLFLIVYAAYIFPRCRQCIPICFLLALPVLLVHTALLGLGVGLWSNALTVKYRDLSQLISFGVSLWMWATPIIYPLSLVPERFRFFVYFNPMAPVVELFRYSFTGAGTFALLPYATSIGVTAIILFTGLVLFHRAEQTFVDIV